MEHLIGKRIKITTPTNRVFYGECIYILKEVHVGVLYDNGTETAFNTNDGVKVELDLVELPKAIKATELPSKAAAVEGILTEEELKELLKEVIILKGLKIRSSVDLINSHRNLLSANAELSFKNMELQEENKKMSGAIDALQHQMWEGI